MDSFHPLTHPVGAVLRHVDTVDPQDSLARAAWILRESGAGLVPVVQGGAVLGGVTDRALAEALERGIGELSSVSSAMDAAAPTIPAYVTGAEALRRLAETETRTLIVVDSQDHFLGILSASDLYPRAALPPALPPVGGMATPFGVYLTSAGVRGGAGPLALVSTGMLLSFLILVGAIAGEWLAAQASGAVGLKVVPEWMINVFPLALFMVGLRAIPLAGTHAAEHQVVHALERGEPLELEVVRRMPRVHPRCGTNLAVALSLFFGLVEIQWTASEHWRILGSFVITLLLWKPLGNTMQFLITTKPPNDRQLLNGIQAGKELIHNIQAHRRQARSVWTRILSSGMLHVMAGSLLMTGLFVLLSWAFGWNLGIELY